MKNNRATAVRKARATIIGYVPSSTMAVARPAVEAALRAELSSLKTQHESSIKTIHDRYVHMQEELVEKWANKEAHYTQLRREVAQEQQLNARLTKKVDAAERAEREAAAQNRVIDTVTRALAMLRDGKQLDSVVVDTAATSPDGYGRRLVPAAVYDLLDDKTKSAVDVATLQANKRT